VRTHAILTIGCSLLFAIACGPEFDDPFEEPTPSCSQSCAGCCSGNECIEPSKQSFMACGSNGTKCAFCTGTTSCLESSTNQMACGLDKDLIWHVQPISASIAPQTPAGYDWDADSSPPDVVVMLTCPPKAVPNPAQPKTSEVSSFTPQWTDPGCDATSDALLSESTLIKVLDVDVAFNDDIAIASYTFTEQNFEAGTVVLQLPDNKSTLTIRLVRKN